MILSIFGAIYDVICLVPIYSGVTMTKKVGGDQSTTFNVIYQNVHHILKFMNPPGYSGHCWCGLRNLRWRPRWPPDINVRGCYIGFGAPI